MDAAANSNAKSQAQNHLNHKCKMIPVDELRITKTRTQVWQEEAGVLLGRLSQKTEGRANQPNSNDDLNEKAQSSVAICVHHEQRSGENQRAELADKEPCLRRIRTCSLGNVIDSARAEVRPRYGLEKGERD